MNIGRLCSREIPVQHKKCSHNFTLDFQTLLILIVSLHILLANYALGHGITEVEPVSANEMG